MPDLDLAEVYRLFIDAFVHLESSAATVLCHQRGPVTHLEWPNEGRRGGRYHHEFFALDQDPQTIIDVVKSVDPQQPYFISEVYGSRSRQLDAFTSAGFAFESTEPIMTRVLGGDEADSDSPVVADVTDSALADRVFQAFAAANSGPRRTTQAQIDDPATLIKSVFIDGEPAAHGKGILIENALYITDIGTIPAFRKRGLGGAIMTALHHEAQKRGARHAILSATQMAAPLYRSLGYTDVGTLDIYIPAST
jgi:ribosomal protein S18 acetylase RimI-like enzyme